jgi:hypothetical protein
MLKSSQTFIIEILHKLFNSILSNGSFPKIWAKGIIVPIFKNGIKDDPANYRGLTTGIRLDKFCIKRQLIRNEQIGFSKGNRTSDHIFVLKTVIDKYCKQGSKRLFSCFVDFRRAFDTVRHDELFFINYALVA